ncbi:hypothetical protein [Frankia sp. AgB32]|uniref:hypothetical protein n=1 Tax=Frankia sp. AgB32 TaxID=631119 RepID=UPI00201077E3|nr:hypothetical protein [Frankia sp. AgB32]MCK9898134.1 hypothetical protein [Frankia sp. AgB32]
MPADPDAAQETRASRVIVVQLPDGPEFSDVLRAFNAVVPAGCKVFGAVDSGAEKVLRVFSHLTADVYRPEGVVNDPSAVVRDKEVSR